MANETGFSRRQILKSTGAAALCWAARGTAAPGESAGAAPEPVRLSEHLFVIPGPVNVGVIRNGDRVLLIDCGDGQSLGALARLGKLTVERLLCTHHHRDQVCGAAGVAAAGARIGVPSAERDHFDQVGRYWNDPKHRYHQYYFHPHRLMLAEPVKVDDEYKDGDSIEWGPARIRVLATPGHTDGSLSYLVEVDGEKTVFSGDLICDDGRLPDIHSLQKGFSRPGRTIRDYHGFLGGKFDLIESLKRVKDIGPGRIVPSHGPLVNEPAKAIDQLTRQLDLCYDQYVAISALRHYFPESFSEYAGRKDHMAFAPTKPLPAYLRHIQTSWILISREDKAAFVMDCWNAESIRGIRKLIEQGEIRSIEGIWATHYHDDHVDAIPELQTLFNCPCITDSHVAQIITNPREWQLPCLSPNKTRVDKIPADGESWTWREFRLTSYHFPGQTLHHAGLLVEGRGDRLFFTGDSFTPAGIDDYCALNRNWLGKGVGFHRCIALLEKLNPTHLFNCHVDNAWSFAPEQYQFMRANLEAREASFGRLVAWEHSNFAMDESWVRCRPYEQDARAGGTVEIRVSATNHASRPHTLSGRAILPEWWFKVREPDGAITSLKRPRHTVWSETRVAAKEDGSVSIRIQVPDGVPPGRYIIPVDVKFGPRTLPQITEAIVVLL